MQASVLCSCAVTAQCWCGSRPFIMLMPFCTWMFQGRAVAEQRLSLYYSADHAPTKLPDVASKLLLHRSLHISAQLICA
jgi:hypothetical protein